MLTDGAVRLQVLLERYKSGQTGVLIRLVEDLERTARDLLAEDELSELSRVRLERILHDLALRLQAGGRDRIDALVSAAADVAAVQAEAEAALLSRVTGNAVRIAPAVARAAALSAPMAADGVGYGMVMSAFVAGWWGRVIESTTGLLRRGAFERRGNRDMQRDIRGTRQLRYRDGHAEVWRRHARTTTATAIQHASVVGRETAMREADIQKVRWVSMLERRTCARCRALDRRVFTITTGPRPPIHPNCRCTMSAMPDGWERFEHLATRTAVGADGEEQVDGTESYYQWLQRQPRDFVLAAFGGSHLGKQRARLFLDGGLSAKRFAELQLDRKFEPISLDELRRLAPLAFRRAGL